MRRSEAVRTLQNTTSPTSLTCVRQYEGRTNGAQPLRSSINPYCDPPLTMPCSWIKTRFAAASSTDSAKTPPRHAERGERVEHRGYCRSNLREDNLGITRSSIICIHTASYASLSPLSVLHVGWKSWKHRGDRRGWEWGCRSQNHRYIHRHH